MHVTMSLTTITVVCACLLLTIPDQSYGFSPHFMATLGAMAPTSMDHQEITNEAALAVLKDYLLDNPNTKLDSTTAINSLQQPNAWKLFGAYFHGTVTCSNYQLLCRSFYTRYTRALRIIKEANSEVDDLESAIPKAHFDNEQIPEGNNRLLVKRESLISLIQEESYQEARSETGRALHTIQDFYAHSNWVELGYTDPWEDLGRPGRTLSNLAGERLRTCTDCEEGEEVGTLSRFFGQGYVKASREYNCTDNIDSTIQSTRSLTTGYYGHDPNAATGMSTKPTGKCSHGGVGDITSDFNPVGGINKDTKSNRWSPHSYLHVQAADLAVKASIQFLQDIREAVGDGMFAKFLDIEQFRSSIAFVIDTTGSMSEELPEIQASLPRIQRELQAFEASLGGGVLVDYILVPFNDPDPGILLETTSIPTLIGYIQALQADGGGDCREPSIGAAIRAARASHENTVINLYTDAPPSDEERTSELISLIKEKGLTMNSLVTIGCSRKKRDTGRNKRQAVTGGDVYEYLSDLSGGQRLDVSPSDLSSVESIIFSSFKPSTLTIFQQTGASSSSGSTHTVEFGVDSTLTEFQITINGNSLASISLYTPQGQNALFLPNLRVSLDSTKTYVATYNTSDGIYFGTWRLSFVSTNSYRVYITGDSILLFGYNLYRSDNTTQSGLREVREKVLEGEPLLLLIEIDQDLEDANVTSTSILSSNGSVYDMLTLNAAGDGYFYAEIEAPASSFQIQIAGVDSQGFRFTRISRAGVDTTDIQIALGPGQSPFQVLRADENQTVTILLSNFGPTSTFTIEVAPSTNSSEFSYSFDEELSLNNITLGSGETQTVFLVVAALGNVTEANSLSLILTLFDNDFVERSNFLKIDIGGTSVPPVNRTTINFFNAGVKVEGATLSGVIAMLASLWFIVVFVR